MSEELLICKECGKEYKSWVLIIDNNPLSVASYIEKHPRCKECYEKENVTNDDKGKMNMNPTKEEVKEFLEWVDKAQSYGKITYTMKDLTHSYFDVLAKDDGNESGN